MGFVDPEVFVKNHGARDCEICGHASKAALAFIHSKKDMWKERRWTALVRWFIAKDGGNLDRKYVSEKKVRRHFEQCLGGDTK